MLLKSLSLLSAHLRFYSLNISQNWLQITQEHYKYNLQ